MARFKYHKYHKNSGVHDHAESGFKIEHYTVSILMFMAAGTLGYALAPFAGAHWFADNLFIKIFDQDSFAGTLAQKNLDYLLMGIIFGIVAILIYQSIRFFIKKFHLLHMTHVLIVMSTSFWAAVAIVIISEWQNFVISETEHFEGFFGPEFWIIFVALVTLFFGLMFNAGFEHRIAALVKNQPGFTNKKEGPEA